ncbi:MAG: 16S rRNA (guanine(527)-N(7))-methyltransferase RsmG [Planctomycetota bacterium]
MKELQEAIAEFGLEVPEHSLPKLDGYCRLLWAINHSINLTRHTDFHKFVSRDLVDTLELSRLIGEGEEVLDIGSGGGVPGMVLAILRPDLKITLTDSVGKKSRALDQIAEGIGLEIEIYNCRAEELLEDIRVDVTTARAVGPMIMICRWLEDSWLHAGRLLAIKGPKWVEEEAVAREAGLMKKIQVEKVAEYLTPGTDWNSVILELKLK